MKIVRDAKYRLRNGDIVRCLANDLGGDCPVACYLENRDSILRHVAAGKFYSELEPHPLDIVAEHREPREFWVGVNGDEAEIVREASRPMPLPLGYEWIHVREVIDHCVEPPESKTAPGDIVDGTAKFKIIKPTKPTMSCSHLYVYAGQNICVDCGKTLEGATDEPKA